MLFNSFEFALFLPLVFSLYWAIGRKRLKTQNTLLLVASYLFYGWWDWRFLSLIAISTAVDYFVGIGLEQVDDKRRRRALLALSLAVNLGLLGVFKYYNFFVDSLLGAFDSIGVMLNVRSINVVLPVGISFYTFQTLSYSIDVYRGDMRATRDPLAFAAFVSFFPQLVAGPIERAQHLLPQFQQRREFDPDHARGALRLVLWGLFKKVAVADAVAPTVDAIFANASTLAGPALALGAVLFAFQIYGDFSGYSDIAIGTARLFGFSLMTNFRMPYLSRSLAEFWHRWHISLSTWFRDYVYIPLGGNRQGRSRQLRNVVIVFVVSGLWHGANWTFVVWGFLNGLLVAAISARSTRSQQGRAGVRQFVGILVTFAAVCFLWIFFRAESLGHAVGYIAGLARGWSDGLVVPGNMSSLALVGIVVVVASEAIHQWRGAHWITSPAWTPVRWAVYYAATLFVFLSGSVDTGLEFIYFQF